MKKKILTTSYSPAIQGSYGIVMRELMTRIYSTGKYEIISHGWLHADISDPVPWQVIPTMVKGDPSNPNIRSLDESDRFGQRSLEGVIAATKPDMVFALGDQYMLQHLGGLKNKFPTISFTAYLAVDGEPWHQGLTNNYMNLDHIMSLSLFGSRVLKSLTNKDIKHLYHGYDPKIFKDLGIEERRKLRTASGMDPDKTFLIGWVGKNQFRKQNWKLYELMHYITHGDYIQCSTCNKVTLMDYDRQLGAIVTPGKTRLYPEGYDYTSCYYCNSKEVIRGQKRENVFLWNHCTKDAAPDGWNNIQLGDIWRVKDKVFFTDNITHTKGVGNMDMNNIYNMFDLLYYPTGGEGFGIPLVEAMASGVPVMYPNYSSCPEVMGDAGISVPCALVPESMSCFDRSQIRTEKAIEFLIPLIEDKNRLTEYKNKGLERAKLFQWDDMSKQLENHFDNVSKSIRHSMGVIV